MDNQSIIQINQKDNVAVALRELAEGSSLQVAGTTLQIREAVPRGHKIALKDISEGEEIIKYGNRIGIARCAIPKGSWVHVHNIRTGLGDLNTYSYTPDTGSKGGKEQDQDQDIVVGWLFHHQMAFGRVVVPLITVSLSLPHAVSSRSHSRNTERVFHTFLLGVNYTLKNRPAGSRICNGKRRELYI